MLEVGVALYVDHHRNGNGLSVGGLGWVGLGRGEERRAGLGRRK